MLQAAQRPGLGSIVGALKIRSGFAGSPKAVIVSVWPLIPKIKLNSDIRRYSESPWIFSSFIAKLRNREDNDGTSSRCHNGRVVKLMGKRNADMPAERHINIRNGINIGDLIVEESDIRDNGIHLAARLEGHAERHVGRIDFRDTEKVVFRPSGDVLHLPKRLGCGNDN